MEYYEFPEKSIEIGKFMSKEENLKQEWKIFVDNIEDSQIWESGIILDQIQGLEKRIRMIKSHHNELSESTSNNILGELDKKIEFISYVAHLQSILDNNQTDSTKSDYYLKNLELKHRFWIFIESYYNKIFFNKIILSEKLNSISQEIEKEQKQMAMEKIDQDFIESEVTIELEETEPNEELEASILEKDIQEIEKEKQMIKV